MFVGNDYIKLFKHPLKTTRWKKEFPLRLENFMFSYPAKPHHPLRGGRDKPWAIEFMTTNPLLAWRPPPAGTFLWSCRVISLYRINGLYTPLVRDISLVKSYTYSQVAGSAWRLLTNIPHCCTIRIGLFSDPMWSINLSVTITEL